MTARPRILWVSYTGSWVGPTNSLSLLLQHLEDRFDSTVLVTGEGAFTDLLAHRGIPYHVIPVMGLRRLPAVTRFIRRGRYDLVYGNCTSGVSATASLAAKLAGVPFVCHVRNLWLEGHGSRRWLFRLADGAIAVSRSAADAFAQHVRGVRPRIVYNGVPVDRRLPPREEARRRLMESLEIDPGTVVHLSLGHLTERKGQIDAVEAFSRVAHEDPHSVLLLVGRSDREPEYTRRIEERIASLGVGERVSMLGFRRDVDTLTAAADVLVHTAKVDPHPRAVLEGMAAGLPTAAYAVDGVAETVVDGETGFLAPPGDVTALARVLQRLTADPALRARLGRSARARVVRHFDAADTAREVGDVVDEILGRPRVEPREPPASEPERRAPASDVRSDEPRTSNSERAES